ncbi:TPA: hypothetical protein P5S08_004192 [Salmonella enterica subsp. enterica serovar Concord]|nr:hypothetical protein [Salmonella enterica subsp. enterica serovar Concord]
MGQETSQDISRHDLTHFIVDYRYYEPGDIVPDVYLTPPYVIKAWWLRNLPPPVQYSTDKLVVSIQYGLSEAMNEIIRSRMVDNDRIKCADISAGEFAWYKLNKG